MKRRMKEIIIATESERERERERNRDKERDRQGMLKETNNKREIETFRSVE